MSWAGPDDVYLSTSLASYLDSKLSYSLMRVQINLNCSQGLNFEWLCMSVMQLGYGIIGFYV